MIDVHRLIGEVAARNGIRVEPDDPAFVLVTLNQLVLEDAIVQMCEQIRLGIAEFTETVHKTEARAGKILAVEVRESAAGIREELQRDVETARTGAREIIYELHRKHTRVALIRWGVGAIVLAAAMFAAGFCIGVQFAR
jgi:hypothetical protein